MKQEKAIGFLKNCAWLLWLAGSVVCLGAWLETLTTGIKRVHASQVSRYMALTAVALLVVAKMLEYCNGRREQRSRTH